MKYEFVSSGPEVTGDLGFRLGRILFPPAVLALSGPLGGGKTRFVQGIALGLEIGHPVTSPTYTIANLYETGIWPFYHCDCYRMAKSEEFRGIGLEEILSQPAVIALEWADRIKNLLPEKYLEIKFSHIDENIRLLEFFPSGKSYEELLNQLENDGDISCLK